jgi:hypothetical protein
MATFLSRPPSSFEQAPLGPSQAVLCDVEDRGLQKGVERDYYAIELSWQLEKRMKQGTGARYLISRSYGQSLHPKSKLSPVIEALLGRPLTQQERIPGRFDLDLLIGMNCIIEIYHEEKDGLIRSKVKDGAMMLLPGMVPFAVEGYTRKRDRGLPQTNQEMAGPLGDHAPVYGERPAPLPPSAQQRLAETEKAMRGLDPGLLQRVKDSGLVSEPSYPEMERRAKQEIEKDDKDLPF